MTALKSRTTCRACGAKGHWSGDSACPKGSGKGKASASPSSSTASTKGGGKGKNKDHHGKGGYQKPRTVYFAVRDEPPEEPHAYTARRDDFTRVPPPSELDAQPLTGVGPRTSLDGVAPPATLSSLLSWDGRRDTRAREAEAGHTTSTSSLLPAASGSGSPTASSRQVALATSSSSAAASSNWSLVPGRDWDQEMLFQALQENSDVVMDRLISQAQAGQHQVQTAGPMAIEDPVPEPCLQAVPLTGAYDLPLLRPSPAPTAEAHPGDAGQAVLPEVAKEAKVEKEEAKVENETRPVCAHERTTTKGTNKYVFIKTCLKCNLVLERTKKETVESPPAAASTRQHDPTKCPHQNVSQAGTNRHVWKWYCKDCGLRREGRQDEATASAMGYGALGGRNLEGPDTEAVKVMEMAGTVVMVQESSAGPVPLEKLAGIVAKCVEIYRSKHPAQRESLRTRPVAAARTPAKASSPADAGQGGAPRSAAETGITADAVLNAGKHKGRTFGYVYDEFPDYVAWILSQGGNIQAASLQNFERYIRARQRREHQERQAYMVMDPGPPCESSLVAVLDTGCNQTCHGALWYRDYCRASDQALEPLASPTSAASLNGIGGRVKALGKRTLSIAIQLADGTLATGTVQSTELEDSSAPLLMSYGAQRQLGFVLDAEAGTVYSKAFEQHVDLVDRDGLPALRLLPLLPQERPEHFAMSAEVVLTNGSDLDEEDHPMPEDEGDHWQQQGQAWMRVHIKPRASLYDPRQEPSSDPEIEAEVLQLPFRRTVAINNHTGERVESQGSWLREGDASEAVSGQGGETWTGYTLFFRDAAQSEQERQVEEQIVLDTGRVFAAFDEEKPTVLTKGQRRHLQDGSDGLQRHDATLWAQLDPRPSQKARACQRLLPKGCRTFLLELFAGAAALTAMAASFGAPHGTPLDLMNHELLSTAGRKQLWNRIEAEDPYLLAVTSVKAPWAGWSDSDLQQDSPKNHRTTAERRVWYPVVGWIMNLVEDRLRRGREVIVEAPWESLFWQLRCTERTVGTVQQATQEPLEAVYCDFCAYGGHDLRSGLPVLRPTGLLTSSKAVKERVANTCDGHHWHHSGAAQLPAQWPDGLAKGVLNAVLCELQELNCSVVFAAEDEAEELEEFGMIDGILGDEDLAEQLPPPVDTHEIGREEELEELPPPQAQAEVERERKRKWLAIPRNKRLAIRRLHHMTGHASTSAMVRMLRSAGTSAEVVAACRHFRCQACSERQRPPQPSSTTTAPPYRFNHQVICDAFEVVDASGHKHTILSLVDSGTKFHVAGRVAPGGTPSSKSCAEFINTAWVSWAGPPAVFQVDQGVHNKGQVASLMRAHGVEIRQAGRQAPWQIGRGERHGGILKAMVKRLVTAHQLAGDFAIAAAVTQSAAVKNGMYNHDGYVPSQWVLGRLPHDVTSLLGENETELLGPQQEALDPETVYGKTMQIRQWAKECFIYLDSSQRVRRAMLRQAHPVRGPYQTGDLVSYHRRGRWYGPARVLSHEGKSSLWLVHGGMTLLVAETTVRPATTEEIQRKQALTMRPSWVRRSAKRKYEDFLLGEDEELPFEEEPADFDGTTQVPYFDFALPSPAGGTQAAAEENAVVTDDVAQGPVPDRQVTQPEQEPLEDTRTTATAAPPTENPQTSSTPRGSGSRTEQEPTATTAPPTENPQTSSTPRGSATSVTPLQEALRRSADRLDGHVRSRSPSVLPRSAPPGLLAQTAPEDRNEVLERREHRHRQESQKSLAFLGARSEKRYRKKTVKQGAGRELNYQKATPELKKGLDASRQKEWSNWQKYTNMRKITKDEFNEMRRHDSTLRIIPTRWVDTDKAEAGQPQKLKSRFVVRGDLEDSSSMRTDSPTGSQVAMGILLSYGAATCRTIKSGDISAAFLQGSELDRKLILSMPKGAPPEGMEEDDLVIVSTAVYGTKDAPRGWFKNLDTTLRGYQLRRVPLEPGFYVLNGNDEDSGDYVKGLLLVHVDDLLWVGDSDMEDVMRKVQQQYRFGSTDEASFKFCGRWLKQDTHGIEVSCPDLISRVRPVHLEPRRRGQRDTAATEQERSQLRSVVGSLNWLVRVCRPDLAYSVARLQTAVSKPLVQDLLDANNLVKYAAKTRHRGILYPAGKLNFKDLALIAVQDASYAADYDTSASGRKLGYRSQSGRVLCLASRDYLDTLEGHLYPIEWHSTVIRRVCKSTLQAESLSLQLGAAEAEHARAVLHGLLEPGGKMDAVAWTTAAQDRTPVAWVTDCMSLKEHLLCPSSTTVSDKRLAIDLSSLRQELWREDGQDVGDPLFRDFPPDDAKTRILWTSTDRMLADALTKRISEHGPLLTMMSGGVVSLQPTTDHKTSTGVKVEALASDA